MDTEPYRGSAAIIGIGSTAISRASGVSVAELGVRAVQDCVRDAGIKISDIDGMVIYGVGDTVSCRELAETLGLGTLKWYSDIQEGGPGLVQSVITAALAVDHRMANNVVVVRAMNGRSGTRIGRHHSASVAAGRKQWTVPFGYGIPAQMFALWAQRHMHEYGTTSEDLGRVAVTMRKHAQLNPNALMNGIPLTLTEHQSSRMISTPFRLLDCCLEADGAGAVLVARPATDHSSAWVPIKIRAGSVGAGRGAASPYLLWEDLTRLHAASIAESTFRAADVSLSDIGLAQLYDAFSFFVICQLEDLGFVPKGEGAGFIGDGNIELGSKLPVNTNGGLLSEGYLHGINNLIEAIRQLRGAANARQIEGLEIAVVTGFGGACDGLLVLSR